MQDDFMKILNTHPCQNQRLQIEPIIIEDDDDNKKVGTDKQNEEAGSSKRTPQT